MKKMTLLTVAILSMACDNPVQDRNLDQLHENSALWRNKSSDTYRFKFTNTNWQISDWVGPYHVFVKNGIVDSIYNTFENPEVPDWGAEFAGKTIDQHLLWIENQLKKSYDDFVVIYDSLLGYPKYVYFDYAEIIADEGRCFEIDSVVFME